MFCDQTNPSSLFERASQIIWCLAREGKTTEWDIISMKGFALNNPRKRNTSSGFRVQYVKVFNMNQYKTKFGAQKKNPMQANLTRTIEYLTKYLQDMYNETETGEKMLQVKKAELKWSSPQKMKKYMEDLIQVFHIAMIVIDYVFDFTTNNQPDKLIPFCSKMFCEIEKQSVFWSYIEKYLRLFHNDHAKETNARTIASIRDYPAHFRTYLDEQTLIDPEDYRDALLLKMKIFTIRTRF